MILRIERPSPTLIDDLFYLIKVGGEIKTKDEILIKNISNATYIGGYYNEGGVLVASAVIKNPQESYKTKIFENAEIAAQKYLYPQELGYCVTLPKYRGQNLCTNLIIELMDYREHSLFSTTRNPAMAHILLNRLFRKIGKSWSIESDSSQLSLYIHD